MKVRTVLAILAVAVAWAVLDFVIHDLVLGSTYAMMPELWRPAAEMKIALLYFVVLISAAVFVYIYAEFIRDKGMGTAVKYGILFGIGIGIGMGYGTYAVMPIPYNMALTWFLGTIVETAVGGIIIGLIVKE